MKIIIVSVLMLLMTSNAFATGVATDVLVRDQDGDYLEINSDGTINVG